MYYAMRTPYGATTASGADRLVRFESKKARDAWVAGAYETIDYVDQSRRDIVTRSEARRWFPEAFAQTAGAFPPARSYDDYWDDADDDGAQEWTGAPTGGVYSEI